MTVADERRPAAAGRRAVLTAARRKLLLAVLTGKRVTAAYATVPIPAGLSKYTLLALEHELLTAGAIRPAGRIGGATAFELADRVAATRWLAENPA